MWIELSQSDLPIPIVERHDTGRDRVADRRIILQAVAPLARILELDDFEQGREARANIHEDSERTAGDHPTSDRLPDTEPGWDSGPLPRLGGRQMVAEWPLGVAERAHLPCLRTGPWDGQAASVAVGVAGNSEGDRSPARLARWHSAK